MKNGLQVRSCRSCGTLYADHPPGARNAREDYDGYYNAQSLAVPEFVHQRLGEIIAGFAPYRRTNRLLDVGCGAGSLLRAAASAGWEAEGVEVSRTAAEHVRGEGFRVFCGELAEAEYPAGHFDVVTASEVLEHVADPQALVSEIARVLRPGGLFWATTPHGRGISARVLGLAWSNVSPPEHLQLFSRGGMSALLGAAGFRRPHIATHNMNPFEILAAWRQRLRKPGGSGDCAGHGASVGEGFDRVASSCQLNAAMTGSPARRVVKAMINSLLDVSRLGDSLKVRAEK